MNIGRHSLFRFARPTAPAFAALAIVASLGALVGCDSGRALNATLVSIAVTPAAPTVAKGAPQQLTARGTYSDATTADISSTVTWTSATPGTATISATGLATGVAAGTTLITATRGTIEGQATLTVTGPTAPKLVSIAVTPANPAIGIGMKQPFIATGTFDDGWTQNLTTMVTWASATPAVATISDSGEATAFAPGTTFITATSGTVSGGTTLTAITGRRLVSIAVAPASSKIAKGATQQLTATGTFDDNTTQDLTSTVTWTSATPAVATISAAGVATALAAGTTVISATRGAISGNATLTVVGKKLVSLAVTPPSATLNRGAKLQYTATGTFDDDSTQDLTTMVTWASASPFVATISPGGEATAVGSGNTVISATSGTISGSVALTGTSIPLVSITVTPALPIIAKGTKQQFIAIGTFVDASTQDITSMVTWTSATPATATISATGVATALAPGTTVISATSGALSGSTKLTVTGGSLVSIAVTPVSPAISKGTKQQLTATGIFDDATTQNLTTLVTWTSATASTATVSNAAGTNGEATAVETGTTIISATLGPISGSTMLTVTTAPLVSIAVTPSTPAIGLGTKLQFVATGSFSDGTTQDLSTSVTWASATTATATISNAVGSNGLATAMGLGATVISAASGSVSGGTTLTVSTAKIVSIVVTPTMPSIAKGETKQFVATALYNDATTVDVTLTASWTSSTAAVATISNAAGSQGLASGLAAGSTVISATLGLFRGSTALEVRPAP